jgi:hypothetical protein
MVWASDVKAGGFMVRPNLQYYLLSRSIYGDNSDEAYSSPNDRKVAIPTEPDLLG